MPFVPYLQVTDYPLYGVTDASTAQVAQATRQVNAYLGRPEGLLWSTDANGMPAFMTHLIASRSYTAPVSAGSNVTVTIPNASFGLQTIGEIVILDQANPSLVEACVVTAASGNILTLETVQFTHSSATIDFGLTILEETTMRPGQLTVRAARAPLVQILAGFTRWGYGTLPRQVSDGAYGYNLLLLAQTLGLTTAWTAIDLTQCDINFNTGVIWIMPGLLPSGSLQVRLRYIAGWSPSNLPTAIKQAVANLVRSAIDTAMPGNIKLMKSGDGTLERFSDGVLDSDTKALLNPYRILRLA